MCHPVIVSPSLICSRSVLTVSTGRRFTFLSESKDLFWVLTCQRRRESSWMELIFAETWILCRVLWRHDSHTAFVLGHFLPAKSLNKSLSDGVLAITITNPNVDRQKQFHDSDESSIFFPKWWMSHSTDWRFGSYTSSPAVGFKNFKQFQSQTFSNWRIICPVPNKFDA